MTAPSPLQKFRWPALTLVALCLGFPAGRSLRNSLRSPEPPPSLSSNASTASPEGSTKPISLNSVSDEAVEAEISRLVGNVSSFAGTRTPAQILDAISAANGVSSDLKRYSDTYEAVSELGRSDLADALKRAREENNPIAIRAIERRWAEIDPLGAAKLASESAGTMKLDDAFFASWSKINPSAALAWLESLPDGDQKTSSRTSVINSVAKTNPERALDLATQLPEGADRSQLINRALDILAAKDPAQALAAARGLPEGPSRSSALDNILSKLAGSNLEEAQRVLAELPPNSLSAAGASIAANLTKTDPNKALSWVESLPEGSTRNSAYGALANTWASKDVEAAAAWLDKLPQGASRDSAVAAFAGRTAPRDPEGATAWASTLPPGDLRDSVLQRTLSIWQRINGAAATEWINSTPGLTTEDRAKYTKSSQEPPERRRSRSTPDNPPGN